MDYLSVRQAADILGIHTDTLYEAVKQKRIPSERAGHHILLRSQDVEEYRQRTQVNGKRLHGRPKKVLPAS